MIAAPIKILVAKIVSYLVATRHLHESASKMSNVMDPGHHSLHIVSVIPHDKAQLNIVVQLLRNRISRITNNVIRRSFVLLQQHLPDIRPTDILALHLLVVMVMTQNVWTCGHLLLVSNELMPHITAILTTTPNGGSLICLGILLRRPHNWTSPSSAPAITHPPTLELSF